MSLGLWGVGCRMDDGCTAGDEVCVLGETGSGIAIGVVVEELDRDYVVTTGTGETTGLRKRRLRHNIRPLCSLRW